MHLSQPTTLNEWLEYALGGRPEQVILHNPDHAVVTVNLIPLLKIAGGAWSALAQHLETCHAPPPPRQFA